jgi:hypothetical protein
VHDEILDVKLKPNEDVTIGEVSVERVGGFKLNGGSTATASGAVIHNNQKETGTKPTTVCCQHQIVRNEIE